jgi:hypothetical protein
LGSTSDYRKPKSQKKTRFWKPGLLLSASKRYSAMMASAGQSSRASCTALSRLLGIHFGDIIAHFEDIGNAVGTKPASRAQIRINPYLHRKLL